MHRPRCASKGFTLIELLVVIAIIAILAAILFPVFARVKETARLTRCISHIKQAGQAVLEYAGDWNDTLPTCAVPGYGLPPAGQWVGGDTPHVAFGPPKDKKPTYQYCGKSVYMWQCPSEPKLHETSANDTPYKDFYYWGNSYPMNTVFGGPGPWGTWLYTLSAIENNPNKLGRKISTIARPTRLVMVGERGIHQYFLAGVTTTVGEFRNHDKSACRVPVCFVDGHVRYVLITGDPLPDGTQHRINGQRTYGLFDHGWALAESGWYPGHPEWGAPGNL